MSLEQAVLYFVILVRLESIQKSSGPQMTALVNPVPQALIQTSVRSQKKAIANPAHWALIIPTLAEYLSTTACSVSPASIQRRPKQTVKTAARNVKEARTPT